MSLAFVAALASVASGRGNGQAVPTATQQFQLSVFGGASGVATGFNSGRNLGITAGVDLGIRPLYSIFPSLEIRGTYPVNKGQVDSQRNILAGLKLAKHYGFVRPYIEVLFGRGEIQYPNGYDTPHRDFFYVQSTSNVVSLGVGLDLQLNNRFACKADAQFQSYSSPVIDSGHLFAEAATVGLVYRFTFNHRNQ
jgi:hypothetical protein